MTTPGSVGTPGNIKTFKTIDYEKVLVSLKNTINTYSLVVDSKAFKTGLRVCGVKFLDSAKTIQDSVGEAAIPDVEVYEEMRKNIIRVCLNNIEQLIIRCRHPKLDIDFYVTSFLYVAKCHVEKQLNEVA